MVTSTCVMLQQNLKKHHTSCVSCCCSGTVFHKALYFCHNAEIMVNMEDKQIVYVLGAFKKIHGFFQFLLISIYNEFIFQHDLRHG